MNVPEALTPQQLYPEFDMDQLSFETTAELEGLAGIVGQDRATRALSFGIGLRNSGYNIFVLGPPGTGKATAVRQFIEADAAKAAAVGDWIYLFNFEQPNCPNAIALPNGLGRSLRDDLETLIKELQRIIPAAFESEDYIKERDKLVSALKEDQEAMFQELTKTVEEYSFSIIRLPGGFVLAPVVGGKPISDAQFEKLSDEQKGKVRQLREKLQHRVDKTLQAMRKREREAKEAIEELDERVARFTIEHPLEEMRAKYQEQDEVLEHLATMTDDLIDHIEAFKSDDDGEEAGGLGAAMRAVGTDRILQRYGINLFVDNAGCDGAPVIEESNPNFANLVGRIEHQAVMGALLTDFTMIRPGALHRANGGYLVLDAMAVLERPQAYDALKRALKDGEIRVEEYAQSLGLISTAVLEPEPIPLDVKVVLTGPSWLYYLLRAYDEDFDELFKVQADFDDRMPCTPENVSHYGRFIATLCEREGLLHFTKAAVARVMAHSCRLISDQQHLSTRFRDIADLLTECSYWAQEAEQKVVTEVDVQHAIDEKRYRGGRYRERLLEATRREEVLVSVAGERIGQVNGLSVFELGQASFGRPSRITAQVTMGTGGIIDIEREVKLGGPIHSKGVLILGAFLGGRYAREKPLSVRATLVFEQSYGGVEGDSASLAEVCALISSLGEIPIRQDLGITGSINQHGDVQAIGGINEKVEGFFDTCKLLGELSGSQGVILPAANVQHLVLNQDVINAVQAGQFHLYPVQTVDQALALLTQLAVGEMDEDGNYPDDSVSGRVIQVIDDMSERWQALRAGHNGQQEGQKG